MAWKIKIDKKAEKDLSRLSVQAQRRIALFLREKLALRSNPRSIGDPLQGKLSGLWKYRIGDYRIIALLQDTTMLILVVAIGHRKEIYKR